MSVQQNWVTPPIGSIVMLAHFPGRCDGPHYGLVVGSFKVQGSHVKHLIIAPGTSVKDQWPVDLNTEVVVLSGSCGVGKKTKFIFDELVIYKFPSSDVIESNKTPLQQGQKSVVVGTFDNPRIRLAGVRAFNNGKLMDLFVKTMVEFGIDPSTVAPISATRPAEFLE